MPVSAISRYYPNISSSIVTDLTVENPFNGSIEKTQGIWDTGATNSCISESLAKKLNLTPIQRATVLGVHGSEEVNVYYKMHKLWASQGNEKCPCGSGKLYKNCHGKNQK